MDLHLPAGFLTVRPVPLCATPDEQAAERMRAILEEAEARKAARQRAVEVRLKWLKVCGIKVEPPTGYRKGRP